MDVDLGGCFRVPFRGETGSATPQLADFPLLSSKNVLQLPQRQVDELVELRTALADLAHRLLNLENAFMESP